LAITFAEAGLQFSILCANHECAGYDRECGESPADGEARAYAPGEHFAEMAEIDGMAHTGANAGGGEALLAMSAEDFSQATELRQSEVVMRQFVEHEAGAEQ
jgi:hypothetical protein